MDQLSVKNFKKGLILTISTSVLLFIFNMVIGTKELFLSLNTDLGKFADTAFTFFTFLGDGIWWIAITILFIFFRRKYWQLLFFSFLFSEFFIRLFKSILIPDEARPFKAITDTTLIHTVKGVEIYTVGSFPSGHTTQAFIFFLLTCLMIDKKWIVPFGFFMAVMIGYSRVYLAEHFPRDVAGGMLFASISVSMAYLIYKKWFNPKKAPQ